jgi:D-sedoheptulose 7-phosphate isomerase
VSGFTRQFLDDSIEILGQIPAADVDAVVATIAATRARGGRLFFVGSGGGAGHASHAACDFRKLAGIEAYSVTDNVSELTARINDEGWDGSYAAWLTVSRLNERDCLFVFSVGGGDAERNVSTNLVRAMELARDAGAAIVGVVGRDGGALRELATASVVIPTVDPSAVTPQTEGLQALMWHLIVSHPDLCTATAKWESMSATRPER